MPSRSDVAIIGGGLVGTSLALALAPLKLSIDVIEAVSPDDSEQPSFDARTIALTWSSRQILDAIGAWPALAEKASPIHSIHVSNQGHSGITRLDRALINTEALGYVLPSRCLGQVLTQNTTLHPSISCHIPVSATNLQSSADAVRIYTNVNTLPLESTLVVLADGGRSRLGESLGMNRQETHYGQTALVTTVETDRPHEQRAYERFTPSGPLALLPSGENQFAVAWTLSIEKAESYIDLPADEFLAQLQRVFGDRAGFFKRVAARQTYALSRVRIPQPVCGRIVAVGNAAHQFHPVAGQGFNLGLRDVAELAECISQALGLGIDIGSPDVLSRYAQSRRRQARRVSRFTDGLVRLFSNELPGVTLLRNFGLNALELLPPVKQQLLRRTAGLAGNLPRLARGLPLELGGK